MPIDNRCPENNKERIYNKSQATNPELVDSGAESVKLSPEQMATQKFDELFNKLHGKRENESEYGKNRLTIQKDGNNEGEIIKGEIFTSVTEPGIQNIIIEWDRGGINESIYKLSRINGKFSLTTVVGIGEKRQEKVRNNITPEDVLNNILPNFEKRINEGEIIKREEGRKVLEDTSHYAYKKDQQDANMLLQKNGLA